MKELQPVQERKELRINYFERKNSVHIAVKRNLVKSSKGLDFFLSRLKKFLFSQKHWCIFSYPVIKAVVDDYIVNLDRLIDNRITYTWLMIVCKHNIAHGCVALSLLDW